VIGLELEFSRPTLDELRTVLDADWQRTEKVMSDRGLETESSRDLTGPLVLDWASAHCVDDDGNVPLIDFTQLRMRQGKSELHIRNRVGPFQYCSKLDSSHGFLARSDGGFAM
jgi:hypothetical protein